MLTIKDRAAPLIENLKNDWTKELCGVALMDAGADETGTKIDGVTIQAGFKDFMAWVRRDALDEVYIDVPYDTGDSLTDYLVELESMGLEVHFSVPLLEKIYGRNQSLAWRNHISANIEHRGNAFLIGIGTVQHSIRRRFVKRAMDICGSMVSAFQLLLFSV